MSIFWLCLVNVVGGRYLSDKKSKLASGSIIILLGSIILRLGGFIYRFILSRLLTIIFLKVNWFGIIDNNIKKVYKSCIYPPVVEKTLDIFLYDLLCTCILSLNLISTLHIFFPL